MNTVPPSPIDSAADRRARPRLDVLRHAIVMCDLGDDNGGLMLDLGDNGFSVQSLHPVQPQSYTPFSLLAGQDVEFSGLAEIVWANSDNLAGIRVEKSFEARLKELRHFVEKSSFNNQAPSSPIATATLQSTPYESALSRIVCRCDAHGGALALSGEGGLVCVASSGSAAAVGDRVDEGTGLCGECLRREEVIYCADAELDRRVDAGAVRAFQIRSVLVVPLTCKNGIKGLLQLIASLPDRLTPEQALPIISHELAQGTSLEMISALKRPDEAGLAESAPEYGDAHRDALGGLSSDGEKSQERKPWRRSLRIAATAAIALGSSLAVLFFARNNSRYAASARGLQPGTGYSNSAKSSATLAKQEIPPNNSNPKQKQVLLKPSHLQSAPVVGPSDRSIPPTTPETMQQHEARPVAPPDVGQVGDLQRTDAPNVSDMLPSAAMPILAIPKTKRIVEGRLLSRVDPTYPANADGRTGSVHLKASVAEDGHVASVAVVAASEPLLTAAALQAVKKWRYEPSTIDGKPMKIDHNIVVTFK